MADILNFPTNYVPSKEEGLRLSSWQIELRSWRVELVRAWDEARLNYGQRMISVERFHSGVRGRWKLIYSVEGVYTRTRSL